MFCSRKGQVDGLVDSDRCAIAAGVFVSWHIRLASLMKPRQCFRRCSTSECIDTLYVENCSFVDLVSESVLKYIHT